MNILLVISDSLRAQNTSLHGYQRETTPFLEEFADRSIVYKNAYAPSIWSLPSHASMFTGYHVQEHRLHGTDVRLDGSRTIWEELRDSEYETGVFSSNMFITDDSFGLSSGFNQIVDSVPKYAYPASGPDPRSVDTSESESRNEVAFLQTALRSGHPVGGILNGVVDTLAKRNVELPGLKRRRNNEATAFTDKFLQWVDDTSGEWAALINYMTTHANYEPVSEFDKWGSEQAREIQEGLEHQVWPFYAGAASWEQREMLMDLYDGCIKQVDSAIQHLVEELEVRGELDETLLVITSDHGEGFGKFSTVREDVRLCQHAVGIDDVLLHVPLLINTPDDIQLVESEPVSLTAIYDLLTECMNGRICPGAMFDKTPVASVDSIRKIKHGGDDSMTYIDEHQIDIGQFKGLAQAGYAVHNDKVEKYAMWGDEQTDSPVADEIKATFNRLTDKKIAAANSLDNKTEQRLKDLGYL